MTYELPPADKLSTLPRTDVIEALGHLFEPCPVLTDFLISKVINGNHAFANYKDTVEACRSELLQYLELAHTTAKGLGTPIDPDISKIIAAHPRLGRSATKPEVLSTHSSAEQKSLQSGSADEAKKLLELNEQYEATFPGLRYVVFVNGRPRQEIMENMAERIKNSNIEKERETAFNAMCDIALDRASKLNGSKGQ